MVRLLKGGKVPDERQGTIVEMIGKRGSAADLTYLYERVLDPSGFTPENRLTALNALAEAALTRKTKPEGDLSKLASLLKASDGPKDFRKTPPGRDPAGWPLECRLGCPGPERDRQRGGLVGLSARRRLSTLSPAWAERPL